MDVELLEDLEGQIALVTGANRGMGKVTSQALRELGATVYAGTRKLDAVEPADRRIPLQIDVTDDASIAAAFQRISDDEGRLDVLVNNAGIAPGLGQTVADEPIQQFDQVMAINLRGAFLVTQHATPLLLETEAPRVVNMSSGMGSFSQGMDGEAVAYRISKAGLNAITANLHADFNDQGLIANSACPGWVRTDMGGPSADRSPEEGAETPIWLCRFAPGAPSGRFWRDHKPIEF